MQSTAQNDTVSPCALCVLASRNLPKSASGYLVALWLPFGFGFGFGFGMGMGMGIGFFAIVADFL